MPKHKRVSSVRPPTMTRKLADKLEHVDELLDRHRLLEALEELHELAERHPGEYGVWARLCNAAGDTNDNRTMLMAARRLVKLRPRDPDMALNLAGAYMVNVFPALALQAFRDFLSRWPNHAKAADARETVAELETRMQGEWHAIFPPDRAEELSRLHEQAQVELNDGHYAETRKYAEQVLAVVPQFPPPLNNISLSFFMEGRLGEAVAAARRVIEIDPDNVHALSNLVHYLCLLGQFDEARSLANRLKSVQSSREDMWVKKAEAFSFLGDDAGVLEVLREAEQAGMLDKSFADPFLLHLAAAATARTGNTREARKLWNRALEISPGFEIAQENLDDLASPVGERNGAWAMPVNSWVPASFVEQLLRLLQPAANRRKEKAVEQAARQFMQAHPEMDTLVPILLERGDPGGRQFALYLARMAETPAMLAALKTFAQSQSGPDAMRREAAYALAEAGVFPRGKPVQMWTGGVQGPVLLMAYNLTTEPRGRLPNPAQKLMEKAMLALHDDKPDDAEPLLRQALEQVPDNPSLLNNLALVYSMRGDDEQAEMMTRQILERHPDYVFGRCSMSKIATLKGDFDEADRWLDPVMEKAELHITEFAAMCQARIGLEMARGRLDSAKSWLEMWSGVMPDHPEVAFWREQIEPRSAQSALGSVWRRRR